MRRRHSSDLLWRLIQRLQQAVPCQRPAAVRQAVLRQCSGQKLRQSGQGEEAARQQTQWLVRFAELEHSENCECKMCSQVC